jgi:6-pyruvoyl-tetrahydropterin synthase
MAYTKVVALDAIHNFVVNIFFIQDHLEDQIFIYMFSDLENSIFNFLMTLDIDIIVARNAIYTTF